MFVGKIKAVHKSWMKENQTDEKDEAGSDADEPDVNRTLTGEDDEEEDETDPVQSTDDDDEQITENQELVQEADRESGLDQVHAEDNLLGSSAAAAPKVSPSAGKRGGGSVKRKSSSEIGVLPGVNRGQRNKELVSTKALAEASQKSNKKKRASLSVDVEADESAPAVKKKLKLAISGHLCINEHMVVWLLHVMTVVNLIALILMRTIVISSLININGL